jgi:hypothetical protein
MIIYAVKQSNVKTSGRALQVSISHLALSILLFSPPPQILVGHSTCPATIQPSISAIQCFSIDNLILAMLPLRVFVKLQHRLPFPAGPSPSAFFSTMIQPHCFQALTHSPANWPSVSPFASITSALFPSRRRVWYFLPQLPVMPTFGRFNLRPVSARPIAAQSLWCNNSQRHEISSASRETSPLPPVSKDSERTSGTVRRRSRFIPAWPGSQVVPGSSVLTQKAF